MDLSKKFIRMGILWAYVWMGYTQQIWCDTWACPNMEHATHTAMINHSFQISQNDGSRTQNDIARFLYQDAKRLWAHPCSVVVWCFAPQMQHRCWSLWANLDEESIDFLFLDKWWRILLENVGYPRSAIYPEGIENIGYDGDTIWFSTVPWKITIFHG